MGNEQQRSYYAIIPANVRYDTDLPPNAKLLYGEITALCNEKGFCWATNDYFANLYGVSKTSVSKWISALTTKGYIISEIIYKEGTKEILNRYLRIVNDPIEKKLNTPIEEKLKDNNTSFNNTINNKKVSKTFDNLIDNYTSDESIKELLKEWLKVRKAKRSAMTDKAIQLNLNKLDKLASESKMSVSVYLEEVIARGWSAFYKINNYDNNSKKPIRKEVVPEWFDKKIEKEEPTKEEQEEIDKLLSEFKDDWREEAKKLQEELKEAY